MAGFADFRLKPNERWIVRDGTTLEKVPLQKKGPFGRFAEWATGASSLSNILTVISKKTDKIDVDNRKEVEALVNLRSSVELCYKRTGGFARWVDHNLRHDKVRAKKEKVIDAIYEKLRSHFFGKDQAAIVDKKGDWKKKERQALNIVYAVLSSNNPSEENLKQLDTVLSFLQPNAGERKIWYTEMANLGYATASYRLAQLYELGVTDEVRPNPENAIKNYEEAAKQGCIPALLRLEQAYRQGASSLSIPQNKQQAHHWAVRASAKNDAAALRVCLDLLEGFGIHKQPELAQTKLLKLIDSGQPEYQAKAAFYASENSSEADTAREILIDALKGIGVTIDEDAGLTQARYELARFIDNLGDSEFATQIYLQAVKSGLDAIKRGEIDAAVCLIKIDRDNPEFVTTVSEKIKTIYHELGLQTLLEEEAAKASAGKLPPTPAKATLEWIATNLKGAPLGADLAASVTEFTGPGIYQAFEQLSEDQQIAIRNLLTITYSLHPNDPLTDHDCKLLAGALFGTPHPSDALISIARLLAEGNGNEE